VDISYNEDEHESEVVKKESTQLSFDDESGRVSSEPGDFDGSTDPLLILSEGRD